MRQHSSIFLKIALQDEVSKSAKSGHYDAVKEVYFFVLPHADARLYIFLRRITSSFGTYHNRPVNQCGRVCGQYSALFVRMTPPFYLRATKTTVVGGKVSGMSASFRLV